MAMDYGQQLEAASWVVYFVLSYINRVNHMLDVVIYGRPFVGRRSANR